MRKVKRNSFLARGRRVLEAAPEPARRTAHFIVRIYYISSGGELLCTDSAPLTYHAAETLQAQLEPVYGHARSEAVRVEVYGQLDKPIAWKGARVVVFPSMVKEEAATESAAA